MKPARETARRKAPTMMIGVWRYFSQSVVARWASQIPPPRMGMERRRVRKFRNPTRLFENFIVGGEGRERGYFTVVLAAEWG